MKITVERKELIKELSQLTMIVQDNKIRPALSGVLIKAEQNIEIIGTDLEQVLQIKIEGEILETGKVIIDHREVIEFLKLSDTDNIIIESEGNTIKIENMTFSTYEVKEYPDLDIHKIESELKNKTEIINNIKNVVFAASDKLENIEVNCIRIDENGYTATDRYRMVNISSEKPLEASISIPLKSAVNISKLLETNECMEYKLASDNNKINIEIGNCYYSSRLIDLPYPDVKSIIEAQNTEKIAIMDVKEISKILKKVLIVARNNQEGKNAAIFTFSDNKLEIYAISDKTKIKEKVVIDYKGETVKTFFKL